MRSAFLLFPLIASAADWPQWRGPLANGVADDARPPLTWSATENIAWKADVAGRGHSQPVVWGNRVFLTTNIEGEELPDVKPVKHIMGKQELIHPDWTGLNHRQTLKVLCYDASNGKLLWEQTAFEGNPVDYRHRRNTYASPTPVTDGEALFVYFESSGLFAYSLDGKLLWKSSVGPIFSEGMGAGTSPVLVGDKLIVNCDQDTGEGSFLAAFSKRNGELLWKTPRSVQASWATPVMTNDQLIVSGNEAIIAYDPANGHELWRTRGLGSHAIHTPIPNGDMVIVTSGFPKKRTYGLRLTGEDHVAWTYDKGTAYVPSPILYRGYLYLITDNGMLTCLDPKTGEVKYDGKRVPIPANFFASPVAADGRIFLTSENGETFVIKAGPEHEVMGTNSIGETVYSSMALVGDAIYLRGEKHLYKIRQAR
jgi:outer membrane protein assembly factor BamB